MTLLVLGGVITSSSVSNLQSGTRPSINGLAVTADVRLVETREDAARMFQPQPPAQSQTVEPEVEPMLVPGGSTLIPPSLGQIPATTRQLASDETERRELELQPVHRAKTAAIRPTWLHIPALEVSSAIVPVGLTGNGQMETPERYSDVGWYQNGAVPGQPGRAVLAGHLDSFDGPAVFYRLGQLLPGDLIYIHSSAGNSPSEYIVRDLALFWTDLAPVAEIFGATDAAELVLITCGGPYDRGSASYLQRLVVYATLSTPEITSPPEDPTVDQLLPSHTLHAPS